jgi:hypothetical protein
MKQGLKTVDRLSNFCTISQNGQKKKSNVNEEYDGILDQEKEILFIENLVYLYQPSVNMIILTQGDQQNQ